MITVEVLVARLPGLDHRDLERWIAEQWVRPDGSAGHYVFREVDVARIKLIRELRDDMQVNEEALPIVLSLLDQLYDLRRRVRDLGSALGRALPEEVRKSLVDDLNFSVRSKPD